MADPASPFDLSTYLAFPASAGGMGHLAAGGPAQQQGNGASSSNNANGNAGSGDEYRNFAKGIQMTQMGQGRGQPAQGQQQQGQQQQQQGPRQTPRMASVQLDNHSAGSRDLKASPRTSSSSDTPLAASTPANAHAGATHHLSPYGLDPAAFQSEVRFQLPAFLNPNVSAPTHPGGAEAWSGYGLNAASAMEGMYNATAAGAPMGFPRSGVAGGNGPGNGAQQGMQGGYGQGAFGQGFGYDAGFGMDMGKGVEQGGLAGDAQSWENWTFK